jgi:iron complex outermembrane receptor protein
LRKVWLELCRYLEVQGVAVIDDMGAAAAGTLDRENPLPRPRTLPIALLLALTFVAHNVQAGEPQPGPQDQSNPAALKKLTLEELSAIEVTTPSKEPTKVSNTTAAIYVITGEDIRRSGATCIPEALRLAPGVEVARIDSDKWSIGIRGFGSRLNRSVLVLMDGRTVYTTLFDGTYWEVQDTELEDVDRIEVIRGPGGTIWGPNAVNGVINIITKPSQDTHGMLARVGGGNFEQGFADFRYGGGNGDDFSYRMYGKGFTRGPEDHPDGRNFDDWRATQGGFRLDWNEGRDTFTLQGDGYDEIAGESVQATSYTPPYSQFLEANAYLSGANVMGKWRRVFSDNNDIQLQAYYDRTNRHEPNLGDDRTTLDIDFLQRLRLLSRNQVSWGFGASGGPIHDFLVVSGLAFIPLKRTDYLLTGFFQDEIALVQQRLSLTVGTKLLRTNFTGFGAQPSARLLWTPDAKQSFWAAYTHALRTPSDAEENFYLLGLAGILPDGTPFLARFNANHNFQPEQLNGYEAGYRDLLGRNFYVDVAAFYNHYHDLFSEEFTGAPFFETTPPYPNTPEPLHYLLPAQFGNGLLGYTKGGEIAPEWRPRDFFRLRGSYSFLHMNLGKAPHSGDVGTAPGIVGSSPQHQASVQTSVDFSKRFQADFDFRAVSALPGQTVPGFANLYVHAYTTADARFGWRISRELDLSIVGQNLFQPSHAEFAGDPGPLVLIKRSAYAQLTWSR